MTIEAIAFETISKAQRGDSAAISVLYERYREDVYRYLYYRVGDPHVAEDLTADTFTRMLDSLPRFQLQDVSFRSWLYQIARNLAIDHHRKMRFRRYAALEEDVMPSNEDTGKTVDHRLTSETLRAALNRLNDDQRDVITFRFVSGMSIGEVAQLMKRSEDAIKGLQRRGLMALRDVLAELEVHYA